MGVIAKAYAAAISVPVRLAVHDRTRRRVALVKAKAPFFMPARNLKMPSEIYEQLAAHFRPRIAALEALLEREFTEWKN